eukprot:TRINITY_DN34585_c0_g1_i1.p1 TRINITY_DN34585_c0_g1~~TRINITY_DN34585_c0_g1_i1.p1  ORF type:complete len:228 (+),score=29.89 TRINITY_DN34585_c0_g1_i1:33-686(+)
MPVPIPPQRYLGTGLKPASGSKRLHGSGTTLDCGGKVDVVSNRGAMMKAAYMSEDRGVLHGHGGDVPGAKGCYYCWTGQYEKCRKYRGKSPSMGSRSRSTSRSQSRSRGRSKTPVRASGSTVASNVSVVTEPGLLPVTPYSTIKVTPSLRSTSSRIQRCRSTTGSSICTSPSARSITSSRHPTHPTKTDRKVINGITTGRYHTIRDLPMPDLFAMSP